MKKFLLMLLCGILMLSMFACNEEEKPAPEPPKAPDWELLIEEYDEWATEYVNFLISFAADPTNPVLSAMVGRWPDEIEEWSNKTADMFKKLNDFPEEQGKFVAELNKITDRIANAGGESET